MKRHAQIKRAYMTQTSSTLAARYPGRSSRPSGWLRSSSQLRTTARRAKAATSSPRAHWSTRHSLLDTQRLAIPGLADLGYVVRRQAPAPRLALPASGLQARRVVEQVESRVRERLGRGQGQTPGSALG